MACNKQKFVGRDVVLEYVIGCGDELPQENDWKRLGSMRTKDFTLEWETTDSTADDSVGSLRENLATFQNLSVSGDGTVKASGAGAANLIELTKHVAKPDATSGQPVAWIRATFPDLTFTCFMIVTNMSRSAPYDDVVTYSFEASSTGSDFGLIVDDTPNPDALAPESVEIIPAELTVTVNESFDVEGVVLPTAAPQGLRWTSDNPDVASVNLLSGVVTGTGLGTATITAASTADPLVTNSITVTVVSQAQSIEVTPSTVSVDELATEQLTAAVLPSTAPQDVTYVSADPAVASVSASGLVTGEAAGETTITVRSAQRPSITATVPVTVTAP